MHASVALDVTATPPAPTANIAVGLFYHRQQHSSSCAQGPKYLHGCTGETGGLHYLRMVLVRVL